MIIQNLPHKAQKCHSVAMFANQDVISRNHIHSYIHTYIYTVTYIYLQEIHPKDVESHNKYRHRMSVELQML